MDFEAYNRDLREKRLRAVALRWQFPFHLHMQVKVVDCTACPAASLSRPPLLLSSTTVCLLVSLQETVFTKQIYTTCILPLTALLSSFCLLYCWGLEEMINNLSCLYAWAPPGILGPMKRNLIGYLYRLAKYLTLFYIKLYILMIFWLSFPYLWEEPCSSAYRSTRFYAENRHPGRNSGERGEHIVARAFERQVCL